MDPELEAQCNEWMATAKPVAEAFSLILGMKYEIDDLRIELRNASKPKTVTVPNHLADQKLVDKLAKCKINAANARKELKEAYKLVRSERAKRSIGHAINQLEPVVDGFSLIEP